MNYNKFENSTMDNILERIYKSGLKLLVPSDPQATYKTIVDEVMRLVKADNGSIFLFTDGHLIRRYTTSDHFKEIKPRKKGWVHRVFVTSKPIIAQIDELSKVHPELISIGVKSVIFLPLSYKGKSIGVLTVQSNQPAQFEEKELEIMRLFGSMASMAIRKAQLYDEINQALETRDLFISMAAHELRTPLTTISGYSQLLNTRLAGMGTSESRWAEQLSNECMRLSLLVNELLEVNKIKLGHLQYHLKEVRVRSVIYRLIENFKFSYPHYEINFEDSLNEQEDWVIGDFDKLLQAFSNLLDNSAKFSSPEDPVLISLKKKGGYFNVIIKDKGRGVSKKDLPRIFDRFFVGSNHKTEGMGLGLFLVKNIIDRHHGKISLKTAEGRGTTVVVRIPALKR